MTLRVCVHDTNTFSTFTPLMQVGLLDSVLSQLSGGCGSKRDFAQALARGLGANMSEETRSDFLNDLARCVILSVPRLLYTYVLQVDTLHISIASVLIHSLCECMIHVSVSRLQC